MANIRVNLIDDQEFTDGVKVNVIKFVEVERNEENGGNGGGNANNANFYGNKDQKNNNDNIRATAKYSANGKELHQLDADDRNTNNVKDHPLISPPPP